MAGQLTTHVLDTVHGKPAQGLVVELWRLPAGGEPEFVARGRTNADGRLDGPLLEGDEFTPGGYELRFATAAYWRAAGVPLPEPPFLDIIPIRFAIADPEAHYHVPLLCSPWAYSTYRGS
jgi:hydroxyisourate hydrolase